MTGTDSQPIDLGRPSARLPNGIDARGSLYNPRFEHDACGIGFVAQKSGERSHRVLELALTALCNHAHRGAVAADGKSGDGAGVLTQLPYEIIARHLSRQGITPPERDRLAVGMIFLPRYNPDHRERSRQILHETVQEYGLDVLGWRDVPANGDALGQWAQNLRPYIEQIIVARPAGSAAGRAACGEFERKLYLVRKRATQRAWAESITNFYIASLSAKTIVYKGLFVAPQLPNFYPDLHDPEFKTAIAVFHQRYSTNTFPTWERAQPFRMVCHNGEINTLEGNVTWMRAKEADLVCAQEWGADASILAPVIAPHGSDSQKLDNALDLLVQSGRDIRHALMMMAPKAWENTHDATPEQRAFYHYHSCLQEPWDGPAALSFTDGTVAGSVLDRNGLRPARFVILDDGIVIMSSEAGAVDVDEGHVVQKGRLRPGEMLAVDTSTGLIENDAQIVKRFVERQPYGKWLDENLVTLEQITNCEWRTLAPALRSGASAGVANGEWQVANGDASDSKRSLPSANPQSAIRNPQSLLAAFGYTREEQLVILRPMWEEGREPIGSMGDDTPAAVLSDVPRPLFHYFKQRFAEVTNPPIDSLREEMVMSLSQRLGRRACILSETPEAARLLELPSPILNDEQLGAIRGVGEWESGRVGESESHIAAPHIGRSADDPIATRQSAIRIPHSALSHLRSRTLDATWAVAEGVAGLEPAVRRLCVDAEQAAKDGCTLLILSDRGVSAERAPIPSLLAVSAVHHALIEVGERWHASLIVESGEPREVHHFAALAGYGANAINPWLALDAVASAWEEAGGAATGMSLQDAQHNFVKSVEKGILKVMSKMGIATLDSYCGAQVFEVIGLSEQLIREAFPGTPDFRIGGIGYTDLAEDVLAWHCNAFPGASGDAHGTSGEPKLDGYGFYKVRRGGEYHAYNPEVIRALHEVVGLAKSANQQISKSANQRTPALPKGPERSAGASVGVSASNASADTQHATRNTQYAPSSSAYRAYADLVQSRPPTEPRDLLRIVTGRRQPIPLDQVEPATAILRRFSSAAMSHGALGAEAHEVLTVAMNALGGLSNSGEGGEGEERYHTDRNNKIKQVASGRFGVTPAYLMSAEELQIKMAQGSKPGEGGQLPGHKVSAEIARIRHTTPGVALISPPPHHDIYSIEDLAQLIFDLKQVNPNAAVSVKLVAEAGVGTVAAGVTKGQADVIHISGYNGGTGASPLSSIKNAGVPWELGLAETQQTLLVNGLRGRVRVRVDGGFKTGRDVVIAALLGADEFSFGTAVLVAQGCRMARQCHNNTCPVGIATQRADLRAKFPGKAEMVIEFLTYVAEEVRGILAELGATSLEEIIGHTELLEQAEGTAERYKLDLSTLLWAPDTGYARRNTDRRNLGGRIALDGGLIAPITGSLNDRLTLDALAEVACNGRARLRYDIRNTDRTIGARLSGQIALRRGSRGLAPETVVVEFYGSAGQSFGAFGVTGLHLHLTGQANDYVGKGLGGGEIAIRPPEDARYIWHHNVILGNTALYGATGGELYAAGRAGERFAVRNSGARAVVEGVGDHGCEYMTGGVVVVLGKTGRNFGAGMTGGVAYVYDRHDRMTTHTNQELVRLRCVERAEDRAELKTLIQRHYDRTQSPRARAILDDWETQLRLFWKIAPVEQIAALEAANEGVVEPEKAEANIP